MHLWVVPSTWPPSLHSGEESTEIHPPNKVGGSVRGDGGGVVREREEGRERRRELMGGSKRERDEERERASE